MADERNDVPDTPADDTGASETETGDAKTRYRKVPGRLMRTLKTGGLSSMVGSSYFGGKLLDKFRSKEKRKAARQARHSKNASRVLETMAELRGPIMKIGQLLSTHREVLPDSYTDVLTSLQSKAPPMPYDDVREIIIEEFDAPPEEVFGRFEPEAHAAASIGQVHRAWLDSGEPVAVKVQYPGAEAMVDSDLKNLELGMKMVKSIGADVLRNEKLDMTPIYEEIAEHIRQETDMCREAFNAQLMAEVFADHPDIIVPKVHLPYSGLRVVTYEFIEGDDIGQWVGRDWAEGEHADARERVATLLTDAFWHQLTGEGLLHADPHPGNSARLWLRQDLRDRHRRELRRSHPCLPRRGRRRDPRCFRRARHARRPRRPAGVPGRQAHRAVLLHRPRRRELQLRRRVLRGPRPRGHPALHLDPPHPEGPEGVPLPVARHPRLLRVLQPTSARDELPCGGAPSHRARVARPLRRDSGLLSAGRLRTVHIGTATPTEPHLSRAVLGALDRGRSTGRTRPPATVKTPTS